MVWRQSDLRLTGRGYAYFGCRKRPTPGRASSVAARQPEHVLGHIVENHLLADRRNPQQPRLTEIPFHVELLAVAVPAECAECSVRGLKAGFGGQVLGGIRLASTR